MTRMCRLKFALFIMSFVSLPPSIPLNAHEDGLGNYTARAYPLKEVSPPKIDGILNDEAWKKASPVSGFVWKDFPEKVASEETVCYIVYDRYHLYVGFRCYDSEPENIVNRISRRGNAFDSDVISFFIDPYHDHRTGYKFVCTPGGVKDDNYRYDDSKADSSWEGVWWAEGNIDDLGWTAEFKIPFSNFRFTDTEKQVWGINFERFIRRKRETDAWKPLGSDGGYWTRMSALGHLIGLEGIQSSEHVEVYPYFMGGTTESQGKGVKGRSDLGIDFQYRLTNQFRLSSMVNPDFAQVEADQLEINLTRFPTRFAEKRPFFIEGNSIFATPLELYYSRRIGNRGDILWGTNVTGKVGNYTLGFISSQTGDWNYFGLQDETETKERALFTILRTKRDILEKSNIGILYAGKEMMDENQRVLGLDANVEVGENAFFIGQIAQSWNALSKLEPARAYLLTFTRKTDRFNTEVSMDRMEPEFSANQTGFLQKELYRGWQGIGTKLEYTPRPSVLGLEKLFIGTQGHLFQGLYTDDYFLDLALKNPNLKISPFFDPDILLWSNIMWVQMRFRESVLEQFGVMFSYSKESELTDFFWAKTGSIFLRTDTAKRIFTTLQLNMGDFYNFSQKYVGKQSGFNLSGTLRPKNNLTFELTTGYAQTSNPDGETDGKFLANSFRVTYLLTRDLFCRLFAQALWNRMYYDQREISLKYLISFLVGWEYSPKSHFFIAYNEDWDTSADRLRFSDRVIVAKISYLWNL